MAGDTLREKVRGLRPGAWIMADPSIRFHFLAFCLCLYSGQV